MLIIMFSTRTIDAVANSICGQLLVLNRRGENHLLYSIPEPVDPGSSVGTS